MKTPLLLLLSLLALPLQAEVRAAARVGAGDDIVGSLELDVRRGNWSFSPAYEVIRGGYDQHAVHLDVRRIFPLAHQTLWLGAGPTFVHSNATASDKTWNVDAGFAWRRGKTWEPFVAARFYRYELPVFRDEVRSNGVVISIGVSRLFGR